MKSMTILEKGERIIYAAGESGIVYAFSLNDHDLIDLWSVGNSISAIDCLFLQDGGTVFAIGCEDGKIYFRIDWEEFPKFFEAG